MKDHNFSLLTLEVMHAISMNYFFNLEKAYVDQIVKKEAENPNKELEHDEQVILSDSHLIYNYLEKYYQYRKSIDKSEGIVLLSKDKLEIYQKSHVTNLIEKLGLKKKNRINSMKKYGQKAKLVKHIDDSFEEVAGGDVYTGDREVPESQDHDVLENNDRKEEENVYYYDDFEHPGFGVNIDL